MPRYLKKNEKSDEKKHVSTRIRSHVLEAFQNASEDAKLNGYTLTLSSVVEEALKHAISEYKDAKGTDFLEIELDKLHQEWINEKEEDYHKDQEKSFLEKVELDEESYKEMEREYQIEFDKKRKIQDQKDTKALLSLNPEDAKKYKLKRKKEIETQEKENLKTIEDTKKRLKLINKLFAEKTKKYIKMFSKPEDYLKVVQEIAKEINKEVNNEK
jgi:hypothetical protein